jgi:hypothetical protein
MFHAACGNVAVPPITVFAMTMDKADVPELVTVTVIARPLVYVHVYVYRMVPPTRRSVLHNRCLFAADPPWDDGSHVSVVAVTDPVPASMNDVPNAVDTSPFPVRANAH